MHQQVPESELADQGRRLRATDQHRLRPTVDPQITERDAVELAAEPAEPSTTSTVGPASDSRRAAVSPEIPPPTTTTSGIDGHGHARVARRMSRPSSCTRSTIRCSMAGSVSGGTP